MQNIISELIPVILIFMLLSYPQFMAFFSHSVLGRFIAVLIIIFYSHVDKYLGLIVCGLVIYYYQDDYVENMLNMNEMFSDINYQNQNQIITKVDSISDFEKEREREPEQEQENGHSTVVDKFREDNCNSASELIYKKQNVRNEMVEHIFPEIHFNNRKCNPCDKSCSITIMEARLVVEEELRAVNTLA